MGSVCSKATISFCFLGLSPFSFPYLSSSSSSSSSSSFCFSFSFSSSTATSSSSSPALPPSPCFFQPCSLYRDHFFTLSFQISAKTKSKQCRKRLVQKGKVSQFLCHCFVLFVFFWFYSFFFISVSSMICFPFFKKTVFKVGNESKCGKSSFFFFSSSSLSVCLHFPKFFSSSSPLSSTSSSFSSSSSFPLLLFLIWNEGNCKSIADTKHK